MSNLISINEFQDARASDLLMPERERKLVQSKSIKEYGTIECTCFNTGHGISYCHYQNTFNNDMDLEGITNSDYSFLAFNTGNEIHMKTFSNPKEMRLNPNLCFSGTIHQGHRSYGVYAKEKTYSKQFIIIENQQFQKLFGDALEYPSLNPLSQYHTDYFSINYVQTIERHQHRLLNEIAQAKTLYKSSLQEMYLEAKILELTYSFFQRHNTLIQPSPSKAFSLNSDDIKSLEKAKKILLENLQNPPSIKELAYKSAINEFKLKKGFKQIFGYTVYGMLHAHRLENAKELLLRNDISIQEAASMVGYHSMGHFSKIFKEKYGIFPIQLKKNKGIYF